LCLLREHRGKNVHFHYCKLSENKDKFLPHFARSGFSPEKTPGKEKILTDRFRAINNSPRLVVLFGYQSER
jgi:hypothetical protein